MERTYLRSGKVIGITIALLVFYQILLASRFKILEQVFSAKKLLFLHRINGMAIAFLVVLHPLLIKASENFTPYTFDKKYFPEFLGLGVLLLILTLALTSIFRKFFRMPYNRWRLLHGLGATLVLLLMPSHILFVSETFSKQRRHAKQPL
jgi:predicted ferric reductase